MRSQTSGIVVGTLRDRVRTILVGEVHYLAGDDIGGGDHETDVAVADALEMDIARQHRADGRQIIQVGPRGKREIIDPRAIEGGVAEHREAPLDLLGQERRGDGKLLPEGFEHRHGVLGWLATIAAVKAPMETPET
jgi:hypothetical protein